MDETRGKRAIVILSSSSSEELDDLDTEDSFSDNHYDEDQDDDDDDDDDDESSDDSDDESLSNKVLALLQGFSDGFCIYFSFGILPNQNHYLESVINCVNLSGSFCLELKNE